MFTFLSFLLCIAGSINWLMIGLLQYDFIAGLFGFQASIFSRLVYILFGIGAVYLVLRVIINKGTFKVFERKKKKNTENSTQQNQQTEIQDQPVLRPVYANVEAANENVPQNSQQAPKKKKKWWQFWKKSDKKKSEESQSKHDQTQQDYENTFQNNEMPENTTPQNQQNFQSNPNSNPQKPININIENNPSAEVPQASQDNLFDEHFKD